MITKKYIYLSMILSILLINFSYSQTKVILTLDEAVQTGITNSKTLHSSKMKMKFAEAKVSETGAAKYATLKFIGSYKRLSAVDPFAISTPFGNFEISPSILNNYSTQLAVSQPLFMGNRLTENEIIAGQTLKASEADFSKDTQELVLAIKNGYWNLYKASLMKNVIDTTISQINAHLIDAKNLLKGGLLTQNDILKIEVQLSDATFKQIEAENGVRLTMASLNNIIGQPLETELDLKVEDIRNDDTNFGDLKSLINSALQKRPEIKSLEFKVKTTESAVTMAKAGSYPTVNLFANYFFSNPNQRIVPAKEEFKGTWEAGINFNFDIWNWKTTAYQTDQAEANLAQTIDGLGSVKDGIALEVTQNYLTFSQSKKKIEISNISVGQATEYLRVVNEKFKTGYALSSDLIDAESALLQAKTNYTNAFVDFKIAKARLEKSLGLL